MSDTEIENGMLGKRAAESPVRAVKLAVLAVLVMLAGCSGEENAEAERCEGAETVIAAVDPLFSGGMAAFQALDEPRPLPEVTFNGKDGEAMGLDMFKGKTVLLNLWATWCAPCRHEMPAFDALQAELGGEKFEVVPVSVDRGEPSKPLDFYDEVGLENLGFFHDPSMAIFNDLKKEGLAFGLPVTVLIDSSGCAVASMNGPADWANDEAKAIVEAALTAEAE